MKIIDNKKDYYDYVSGVNGIDPLAVYDRRGSVAIDMDSPYIGGNLDFWFGKEYYNNRHTYLRQYNGTLSDGYILEVGYVQYLFMVRRKEADAGGMTLEPELLEKRRVEVKAGDAPLVLIPAKYHHFDYKIWKRLDKPEFRPNSDKNTHINNPILAKTYIPSFIPAEEIWNEICSYLLSVREKPFVDNRGDVEKAESHGFDRKTSFRGKNK